MAIIPSPMDTSAEQSSSDAEAPTSASSRKHASVKLALAPGEHEAAPSSSSSAMSSVHPSPQRNGHFWFHDGSVILQVESQLFRVHQTILANHSEVFAGLFEIPQPPGETMLEGCHIVVLHDNEKEFEELLHAVYNPSYFDTLSPSADVDTVLTFISGLLRLSTKYLIRTIRQRCTALLTSKFPSTFDAYVSKSASASTTHERYTSDSVMRAIDLARSTNVPCVLPYAFYCVARMSMKRLMKPRPGDVSWEDKCRCLVGRERLRWAEMSVSHSFLLVFQRAATCRSVTCAHTRGPHAEWHILEASKSPNPLRGFTRWAQMNVCKDCEAYCQALHLTGRREVWGRLPSFFELGTWESLEEVQKQE